MTTVKVKFRPSSVSGKAGTIVYQLIHLRKVRQVGAGIRVLPAYWDNASEQVLGRCMEAVRSRINNDLELFRRIVFSFERAGDSYTVDDVAGRFRTFRAGQPFLCFLSDEIRALSAFGKWGTARNYRSALHSFSVFLHDRHEPFVALTASVVGEYSEWLLRRGLSRNTVSFYMRILRSAYNKAVRRKLVGQCFPFREVYTGVARTGKRALPEEVIVRMQALALRAGSPLAFARDLFIFSYCMRGMAFVDMAYLRKTDIRNGKACYYRRKTAQLLEVRLERISCEIVDRYAARAANGPYVFPILKTETCEEAYRQYQTALRYYNRQLKRLSHLLDLEVGLTSYTARHSWATAARNHNIPLSVISAGMGHTSEKTTQIYLATLETAVIDKANEEILRKLQTRTVSEEETVQLRRKGSKTN